MPKIISKIRSKGFPSGIIQLSDKVAILIKIFRIDKYKRALHYSENGRLPGKIIDIIFNRRMNELPLATEIR